MVWLVTFAFLSISLIPAVWSREIQGCAVSCSKDRIFVCAYHPLHGYRIFSDRCSLDNENSCYEGGWLFLHSGPCSHNTPDKCATYTPNTPVCALSQRHGYYKTFNNLCYFSRDTVCFGSDYKLFSQGRCEHEENCNIFCPKIWSPLCARNRFNRYKTFSNHCELQRENNCYHEDYAVVRNEPCTTGETGGSCIGSSCIGDSCTGESCNIDCPKDYIGICGISETTGLKNFPNTCFMERENRYSNSNYQLARFERCSLGEIGGNCNFCTNDRSEVCGWSRSKGYRTFLNYCYFDVENSCNFADYEYKHDGACFTWETGCSTSHHNDGCIAV